MRSIGVKVAVIFALVIVSCESFLYFGDYNALQIRCADGSDNDPSDPWNGSRDCKIYCGTSNAFNCMPEGIHQCIFKENKCDGIKDCPNGKDELNCPECSLKNDSFSCKDNSSCLPLSKVCDSVEDCKDGSDEGPGCSNEKKVICLSSRKIRLPTGPRCHCGKGFNAIKSSNALSYELCEDIDECTVRETCTQRCTNSPGSYECSCWPGYRLLADDRTCVPRMHSLLYLSNSNSQSIGYYDLLKEETITVVENQNAKEISADDTYLYWTDSSLFFRLKFEDPSSMESFPLERIGLAKGFAVDWWTGNIYLVWSSGQGIVVCAVMGMKCLLLTTNSISNSYYFNENRDIVLHPKIGKMFWISYSGSINSAFMDGKNQKEIVKAVLGEISALTMDQTGDRLFWMDSEKNTLETANLDGSNRYSIGSFPDYLHGSVLEDKIYWISKRGSGLNSANERTGRHDQTLMTSNQFTSVFGFHPLIHYKVTSAKNPCHAKPCSYICLLGENGRHTCGSKFGPCSGSSDCALDENYNGMNGNRITIKRMDIAQREEMISQVLAYLYCILGGLLVAAIYLFFKWKLWTKRSILNLIRPGTSAIEPTMQEPSVTFSSGKEVD